MKIGVPKEIKPQENRIGLTPQSVKSLVSNGHEVLVENDGGYEAGFYNDQYKNAGAKILEKAEDIFEKDDIFNRAKNLAPYFQQGLFSLQDLESVDNIRGYGMMGGIDMKLNTKPGKAGYETFKACYEAGVNFKATGDCLIIAPQFICEEKHIDEIIDKLRTGITNYQKNQKN